MLDVLASFGIDTQDTNNSELSQNNDLTEVLNSNINNLQQLIVPEFLLLLNNLVLNSMYTLSLKSGNYFTVILQLQSKVITKKM